MELEPEVKILDRKLDCSLTPPCGAHESQQRAQAESSSAWSQSRLTRRTLHCLQMAGRLLLITVLGPLLPAVGRRRLCCLFLKQFFRLCLQPLLRLLRRGHPSPASSRQAGQPCCGRRHGHPCGCMSSPLRRREGRQPRCWVAPEAKVCAGGFVNKVGRAVCGLRFADASRISAVWGSTFRDLSIGTLHSCA